MDKYIENHQQGVAITLTREEWGMVCCSLQEWSNKAHASMVWWRDFCDDRRLGEETAAGYAKTVETLDNLRRSIESVLYPQPAQETE